MKGALVGYTSGQIAVRFLGGSNDADDAVQIMVQLFVVLYGEGLRSAFDNLVRVGIIKGEVSLVFALHQPAGDGKIVEATVDFALMKCRRDGYRAVDFNTR